MIIPAIFSSVETFYELNKHETTNNIVFLSIKFNLKWSSKILHPSCEKHDIMSDTLNLYLQNKGAQINTMFP